MATLAEAEATLAKARAAYDAALAGKSVTYGGKQVTYHDIDDLAAAVDRAQREVDMLTAKAAGAKNPGIRIATWQ
jgi:hypothetical protein